MRSEERRQETIVCALRPIPMTWHTQKVVLYLWYAQPILQSMAAAVLWRRKLHKQFPVFFVFLLVQVANFVIIYPLYRTGNYKLYFVPFWVGEAINAILGFKVIHEVFLDVFRPYHTLKDLGTLLFKWAGVVMLLVSVVVAARPARRVPQARPGPTGPTGPEGSSNADFGMVGFSGGSCSLGQVSGPDAAGMATEPTSDGCLIVFTDLSSSSSTLIPLATPYRGSDASVTVTLGSANGHPDVGIGNEGDSGQNDFVAFLEGES